jgi:dTDP-4-amino-4,6-dideoxygalactose transaminase
MSIETSKGHTEMRIPFHIPFYGDDDIAALTSVLRAGTLVGDGPNTVRASGILRSLLGVRHVLLTTSCSHALELAMMALNLKPGDEVVVPSFTFVSTANAVLRERARCVFVDIRPDTLTMDLGDLERRITERTKAIIPVVYAGVSPAMDAVMDLARARGIRVVEDAAQGISATYKGRPAGTTGDMGCYSFHETKNYSTGEGGAFVTNDDTLAQRAEVIREKGTNRKQFLLGLVDKYTWVDTGSSFLPPDSMAALLVSQLDKRETIQKRRKEIHDRYNQGFTELARQGRITLLTIPDSVVSNHHIYYVLMENEALRNRALTFFREHGIGTTFHYLPLHVSPVGRSMGYHEGDFPVTESVSGRLLRLPIYPSLTGEQQADVIRTMQEFFA